MAHLKHVCHMISQNRIKGRWSMLELFLNLPRKFRANTSFPHRPKQVNLKCYGDAVRSLAPTPAPTLPPCARSRRKRSPQVNSAASPNPKAVDQEGRQKWSKGMKRTIREKVSWNPFGCAEMKQHEQRESYERMWHGSLIACLVYWIENVSKAHAPNWSA